MKQLSLRLISFYQKIPGPWHNQCRYYPTCSEYAKEAISKYGFWKGWKLALIRILKCNPLGKYGYDPVPELKKNKK